MAIEEQLTLPSRGIIYPEMAGSETVTITPYKSKAYRDFLSSGYTPAAMNKLIDTCLVDCPLRASDMHPSDWSAVMFKIRAMTLGAGIDMDVSCPFCNTRQSVTWDLSSMSVRYFSPKQYPFALTLPKSGETVYVSVVTPKMTERAKDTAKQRAQKFGSDPQPLIDAYTFVCNLSKPGLDIIGMVDWYDNLPVSDSVYITRALVKINDFGLDTRRWFECRSCGKNMSVTLELDDYFFLPDVGEFGGPETATGTLEGGIAAAGDAE